MKELREIFSQLFLIAEGVGLGLTIGNLYISGIIVWGVGFLGYILTNYLK